MCKSEIDAVLLSGLRCKLPVLTNYWTNIKSSGWKICCNDARDVKGLREILCVKMDD